MLIELFLNMKNFKEFIEFIDYIVFVFNEFIVNYIKVKKIEHYGIKILKKIQLFL